MSLSSSTVPILPHDSPIDSPSPAPAPARAPASAPVSPDPRCNFHPHSTNQNYTYGPAVDGFYKRLIVTCDGTWQRAGYLQTKEKTLFGGTTDVFPSNVARLGWLVDTSCPDKHDAAVKAKVKVKVKVTVGRDGNGNQTGDVKDKVPVVEGEGEVHVDGDPGADGVADAEGETPRAIQQVVYYQAGVGSRGSWLPRTFDAAFGLGLESNVREAYAFLVNNYEPADEISIFGFSRGAYTARSLAGFINKFGILFKSEMEHFSGIWTRYKQRKDDAQWEGWLRTEGNMIRRHMNVPIKCVGVMDTVGSLGVPGGWWGAKEWNRQYAFWDTGLDYGIENAFHALALDEQRRVFSPTMWSLLDEPPPGVPRCPVPAADPQYPEQHFHRPAKNPTPAPPNPIPIKRNPDRLRAIAINSAKRPNLIQCWFPGVHVDIGGGHTKKYLPRRKKTKQLQKNIVDGEVRINDYPHLNEPVDYSLYSEFCNLTLLWLLSQTTEFLDPRADGLLSLQTQMRHRAQLKDPTATGVNWATTPTCTNSMWDVTTWAGSKVRTPGKYKGVKRAKWKESWLGSWLGLGLSSPIPMGQPWTREIKGKTYEVIHPTVRGRAVLPAALGEHHAVFNPEKRQWEYTLMPEIKWYDPATWFRNDKTKDGMKVVVDEYRGWEGRSEGEGWVSLEKCAFGSVEEWVRVWGEGRRWEWECTCLGVGENGATCGCDAWENEVKRRGELGGGGGELRAEVNAEAEVSGGVIARGA